MLGLTSEEKFMKWYFNEEECALINLDKISTIQVDPDDMFKVIFNITDDCVSTINFEEERDASDFVHYFSEKLDLLD
jgi:hypothetical protein